LARILSHGILRALAREDQMTGGERDAGFATTLAKGLEVLGAFRRDRTILTNVEIAALTGISRPTVARLTHTLTELGYLKRDRSRFRLGWGVLMLVNALIANIRILSIARPLMQELALDVGGTVSVGVIDGSRFVYVETARVNENLWATPDLGTIGPLVPTAIGRALCSLLTEAEAGDKWAELRADDPDLWDAGAASFHAGVEDCRSRGFTLVRGTWAPEVHSVGVPLLRDRSGECFALNCRVPVFRLRGNQLEDEIAPRLRSLAASIRQQLEAVSPSEGRTGS